MSGYSKRPVVHCSPIWEPMHADVREGEYGLVSDDCVSILEDAFHAVRSHSPEAALVKAFRASAWAPVFAKISDDSGIALGQGICGAQHSSGISLRVAELQAIVSRAIEIADAWLAPCLCPEHVLLSLVACGARQREDETHELVLRARRMIFDLVHEASDPEVAAREYLSLVLKAKQGDAEAFDRLSRTLPVAEEESEQARENANVLRQSLDAFQTDRAQDFRRELARRLFGC